MEGVMLLQCLPQSALTQSQSQSKSQSAFLLAPVLLFSFTEAGVLLQCLAQMQQSGLSAIAHTHYDYY